MAETLELDVSEIEELAQRLDALGQDIDETLAPVMQRAMDYLWQELPPYPPKPQPLTASKFWTDKQRRWFFAALAEGRVQSPYRRRLSTGLGGSFSTTIHKREGELLGVMGPNVPYAADVIGKGRQARIHQNRWWMFEDEVADNLPGAVALIEDEIDEILKAL